MKIESSNPVSVDGVSYPYFAVNLAMSPIYKPGIGSTMALRLTPFRETEDGSIVKLEEKTKSISIYDVFGREDGDEYAEAAVTSIMSTLQTLINNKEL